MNDLHSVNQKDQAPARCILPPKKTSRSKALQQSWGSYTQTEQWFGNKEKNRSSGRIRTYNPPVNSCRIRIAAICWELLLSEELCGPPGQFRRSQLLSIVIVFDLVTEANGNGKLFPFKVQSQSSRVTPAALDHAERLKEASSR